MDSKEKIGKADDSRINVNESYELQYWSDILGVSRDELKEAVKTVGPIVEDVKRHLDSKKT